MTTQPPPRDLKLLQKQKVLEITFESGDVYRLTCEYLRVFSPSAEAREQGKPKLHADKKDVNIIGIDPVGHYAVKFIFDDGHSTGIYSWETLYDLAIHQEQYWQDYLKRCDQHDK